MTDTTAKQAGYLALAQHLPDDASPWDIYRMVDDVLAAVEPLIRADEREHGEIREIADMWAKESAEWERLAVAERAKLADAASKPPTEIEIPPRLNLISIRDLVACPTCRAQPGAWCWNYSPTNGATRYPTDPIPGFLHWVRQQVATAAVSAVWARPDRQGRKDMTEHDKQCAEFGNAGWIPGVGDCQCELIAKVREDTELKIMSKEGSLEWMATAIINGAREPLIETIYELVQQACYMPPEGMEEAYLDSMALSVYADAMRFLAEEGRIKITSEYGRRVIAERVKKDE